MKVRDDGLCAAFGVFLGRFITATQDTDQYFDFVRKSSGKHFSFVVHIRGQSVHSQSELSRTSPGTCVLQSSAGPRSVLSRTASSKTAPFKLAPTNVTSSRRAPIKLAPYRSVPLKLTPRSTAPSKTAMVIAVLLNAALLNWADVKLMPDSLRPEKSCPSITHPSQLPRDLIFASQSTSWA